MACWLPKPPRLMLASRADRGCGHPIQSGVAPGPTAAAPVAQDLHAPDRSTRSDAILLSRCTAGTVRAVALPVCRAAQITVALFQAARGQVQGGDDATCEVRMGRTHTSVQHEDGGGATGAAALVGIDPLQAPSSSLGGRRRRGLSNS